MNMQKHIEIKLLTALKPEHLEVLNESPNHNVPEHAESHFRVTVISHQFSDKSLIIRHRMVNNILAEELTTAIHALSIHTYTPREWKERQQSTRSSPACRGGASKESGTSSK